MTRAPAAPDASGLLKSLAQVAYSTIHDMWKVGERRVDGVDVNLTADAEHATLLRLQARNVCVRTISVCAGRSEPRDRVLRRGCCGGKNRERDKRACQNSQHVF